MRRTGWLLAVPLSPVVLVAAALTVSVFGAILGLPILLFVGRPWWLGLSVGFGRNPRGLSRSERAHLVVGYVFLLGLAVAAVIVGADDLDTVLDATLAVLAVGLLISAGVGTLGLLRPSSAWPPKTSSTEPERGP
jgi:hypothetical protein